MPEFRVVYSSVPPDKVTHRICWNPNYGGRATGVGDSVAVPIRRAVKPETRERIKESVRREGVRNPILVYITENDIILGFGGGRLAAAKDLGMPAIPAICVDYTQSLMGTPVTEDNWRGYFNDPPQYFEFTEYGVLTHYGLERGRREDLDEAGLAWASDEDMEVLLRESPWLNGEGQ